MPIYVPHDYVLQHLRSEDLLRAGISANLVSVSGTNVHFYHQLILEYLAAVGLAQVGLPTKLARPRFDRRGGRVATKWDQVIIALSGISSKPDWIVRDVAEVDPCLALECVASGIRVSETTRRSAIEHLQAFTSDDGVEGRVAAGRALGLIGDGAAVTFLLGSMRRGPWEVRQASAWVLRELRIPALPGLLEALRDWDQDIRDATATAVRQIGSAAVPVLLAVLHDEHWSMRRGAAWALGEIGDPLRCRVW
jgi:HEAT repeat protein